MRRRRWQGAERRVDAMARTPGAVQRNLDAGFSLEEAIEATARSTGFPADSIAGVDFVAVDMPAANWLTVHILASVAEHEREMISQRTKGAGDFRSQAESRPSISTSAFPPITSASALRADVSTQ